jgi:hypothetical protein
MTDAVMQLFRHRFNQRRSRAKREHHPQLRHYDTFLIDTLQVLVQANHNVDIFPHWSNSCDYIPTAEKIGKVPLCSDELHAAVKKIKIKPEITLSAEKQYLATQMGLPAPFLPVISKEESRLFATLSLKQSGNFDAEQMAISWCGYVQCENIYPKLPVHLSLYREKFLRKENIIEAEKKVKSGKDLLEYINREHGLTVAEDAGALPPVLTLSPLQRAPPQAQSVAELYVGVNLVGINAEAVEKKPHLRSKDKGKRQKRRCKSCVTKGISDQEARGCPGSSGATAAMCKYITLC